MMDQVLIRAAEPHDLDAWARLRHRLWPDGPVAEHVAELRAFFRGELPDVAAAFVACSDATLVGFAEVSRRAGAEGCEPGPVAYLEGWYVAPDFRRSGVGRALVAAGEAWARAEGLRELASDTELANEASAAAHRALGFDEVAIIRCFRKPIA